MAAQTAIPHPAHVFQQYENRARPLTSRRQSLPKVLIIQSEMKQYRVPFFCGLYEALRSDGIDLKVVYSNTNEAHALRKDSAELPPPVGEKVPGRWFFRRFIYQPVLKYALRSDLVIVGPEVKYLINPFLLLLSALGLKTVAYWGLCPNRHPTRHPPTEWLKERLVTYVDWWFAYTASISEYLKKKGMPASRITAVQNATDSRELVRLIADIDDSLLAAEKYRLTGDCKSRIGLFCGVIAEIKDVPMLLEAARLVKQRVRDFHLVLIGDGPDRPWLEKAIQREPWIHYFGFKQGRGLALYFKMADVFVLAGTAGLAIVDCFAAGLPPIVTDLPTHPPEISYIVNGRNGYVAPHKLIPFADAIVETLSSAELLDKLRAGAKQSGSQYTIEAMVQNFSAGIKKCLACQGVSPPIKAGDLALPTSGN
jgi:glycosyltransferase involved in cell wall biosynthesis